LWVVSSLLQNSFWFWITYIHMKYLLKGICFDFSFLYCLTFDS
jgi:hypothetical protein